MQFRVGEHPQLMFTWGANVPDKVKVQKVIRVWPLRFKLRFDYDSHTRSTTFGTSCKVWASLMHSLLRVMFDPGKLEGSLSHRPRSTRAEICFSMKRAMRCMWWAVCKEFAFEASVWLYKNMSITVLHVTLQRRRP